MSVTRTKLAELFPMIASREEVYAKICESSEMLKAFNAWSEERQEEFLDICAGNRGVKMLYDPFFKEILNPDATPERLSDLLSCLLMRKVTVKQVLPNDSNRLGDEISLVITDIVVELEDKTIANVEVQKIGYRFMGQRASCYSADLLLRQYKRVRGEKKKNFSYRDIAPVYTIVFVENSSAEFKEYPENYIHRISSKSDTGIDLGMLQNFIFIPIDNFLNKLHNKGIESKLDAWLTFLACDEPEWIMKLIQEYDQFKDYYNDIYNMCLNIEEVMNMFSKELAILDRNTVKYMIDELQEQLDDANQIIEDKENTIKSQQATIKALQEKLDKYENLNS